MPDHQLLKKCTHTISMSKERRSRFHIQLSYLTLEYLFVLHKILTIKCYQKNISTILTKNLQKIFFVIKFVLLK